MSSNLPVCARLRVRRRASKALADRHQQSLPAVSLRYVGATRKQEKTKNILNMMVWFSMDGNEFQSRMEHVMAQFYPDWKA